MSLAYMLVASGCRTQLPNWAKAARQIDARLLSDSPQET
jgi:hypothetical protein